MYADTISTSSTSAEQDKATCAICRRQVSRYTCPSCNVPYCSLACFRSDGHAQCSESFYKRELESEIRSQPSAGADERRRMMEMLKKFEEDAQELDEPLKDDEDDAEDDLAEKLADVNLDIVSYDELWSLLGPAQRESFLSAVHDPKSAAARELLSSADLQDDITLPWWDAPEVTGDEDENTGAVRATSPKNYGKRPASAQLPEALLRRPSGPDAGPSLLYNICAALVAYAYATRRLGVSPLVGASDDDTTRSLVRPLVPFLSDRHARTLFESMDAIVADLWPRLVDGDSEERAGARASFVLFLRDAARLLAPRRVAVLGSNGGIDAGRTAGGSGFDPETHPQRDALCALSDLGALFMRGGRATPASAKLQFYAAHVAALPAPLLAAFSAEVAARARSIEAEGEGEVGVENARPSDGAGKEPERQVLKTGPVIEEL
ncbi:hypothetical protein M0805_006658 [Coniferiporia weirii]|nr:hypothetical protein M0805_006658 [Coniferiporia weirii]